MSKSWDIVVWEYENAIDYVPSIWSKNETTPSGTCYYKYPVDTMSDKEKREAIYNCADLDNFIWCEAILKKGNIKTLDKAKLLCLKGQVTSNFEDSSDAASGSDEIGQRKRRRPARFHDNIDEDDEGSDVETGLAKRKFNFPSEAIKVKPQRNQSAKITSHLKQNSKKHQVTQESQDIYKGVPKRFTQAFCYGKKSQLANVNVQEEAFSSDGKTETAIIHVQKEDFEKQNQILLDMQYDIKYIKKKIDEMETNMLKQNAVNAPHRHSQSQLSNVTIPCNTQAELSKLEEVISAKVEAKMEMIQIFYLLGGDNVKKTIFMIMKKLMNPSLSVNYSGEGKKQKLPFNKLKLCDVVYEAVRKRHPSATNQEIQRTISLFLASSKARMVSSKRDQNGNRRCGEEAEQEEDLE